VVVGAVALTATLDQVAALLGQMEMAGMGKE
jgi:hypothetical protein